MLRGSELHEGWCGREKRAGGAEIEGESEMEVG